MPAKGEINSISLMQMMTSKHHACQRRLTIVTMTSKHHNYVAVKGGSSLMQMTSKHHVC